MLLLLLFTLELNLLKSENNMILYDTVVFCGTSGAGGGGDGGIETVYWCVFKKYYVTRDTKYVQILRQLMFSAFAVKSIIFAKFRKYHLFGRAVIIMRLVCLMMWRSSYTNARTHARIKNVCTEIILEICKIH